ncbi:glyoxalase family protein [Myxococcus stipitatus DSM 14675]|uniref:Glyoxalase family protein n=1 Tax=Myxococcus stipitatus (strain DSM 14675 / JCM 12634 / Mx s8) TaxID=1278073 RepID=L7UEP1_MYXSD|nr:VOC family protein [Myxococcus stipitatus]AGC46340.1 glyoxalase family protein [Myxococcus stipitatus DSM 14675]
MATTNFRKVFINLPVKDLKRTNAFFTQLGFTFDARFCDDNATCMVLSPEAFVMLLSESRFKDFTKKQICDTGKSTEGIFALSASSREDVNQLVKKAVEAGGSYAADPVDHGFMYGWSFFDLDGHHWEVVYMDMNALPQ